MARTEENPQRSPKQVRRAFLKPSPDGTVSDEQLDAFFRALGLDPAKVPQTEEEARGMSLQDQLLEDRDA